MSFAVRRNNDHDWHAILLEDGTSGTFVSILPRYGASLHAFVVRTPHQAFNVIDHYHSVAELEEELGRSFKSARLSPFVCRVAGAKYRFREKTYAFANRFPDGSAIHGLLYDQPFAVEEESTGPERAMLRLSHHYQKNDSGYPFEYRCIVTYTLHRHNRLQVTTMLINTDKDTIPVADGWHPYFRLGGRIDDYLFQMAAGGEIEFDDRLLPTGRILPHAAFMKPTLFGHTQLDNSFLLDAAAISGPACQVHNPGNHLTLRIFVDAGYPILQLFTPPHRESIAIENLSGAPDCFNNGMGLILLDPGQSTTFTAWYQVSME